MSETHSAREMYSLYYKFDNNYAGYGIKLRAPDLFRKSTDASEVALELSDMFSTSTSNPICHINVFTAYLKTLSSVQCQHVSLGHASLALMLCLISFNLQALYNVLS